ncbi:MAG: class I SAM-dependent methyltransferase [Gammaproteobacteria bacterium]|nr:class I SAM-dependent methyltransferase [Gammaproteobacteria bacterium]
MNVHRIALLLALSALAAPACAAAATPEIIAAVASPARTDKDRERDARDKPVEVMEFAGVKPGMVVADILGGAGYWSELFAGAVGPTGKVMLVNNVPYWHFAREGLKARFTPGRLPNVEQRLVDSCNLRLAPASLDLAVIVMSYHDLYMTEEGWPEIDAGQFIEQIRTALKPGGHLLITDHAAAAGTGSTHAGDLHRIDEEFAKRDFAAHGLVLEKSWDGLRNPADDRSKVVFDASIRGKTDRFVHLYRRQ